MLPGCRIAAWSKTLALVLAALMPLAGGCLQAARSLPEGAGDLFPLQENMTWTFRIVDETGVGTNVITRVHSVEGKRVSVTSGMTEYAYELREDGVFRPGTQSYLIMVPLNAGQSWQGADGGLVEVVDIDLRVEVPAGIFDGCVKIVESVPAMAQSQEHTFCPGVGPVRLTQRVGTHTLIRGELQNYGIAGTLKDSFSK